MSILITGATGKVGSRLARRLAARGDDVRALVRDRERAAALLGDVVSFAEGDLRDAASLEAAVRGVDVVVHCAAFFRGATDAEAHATNDLGTRELARAARAASVRRFVFTSTGSVYGDGGGRLSSEDDACAPDAAYPASKLAAERFLLGLDGLDVCVLRLPFVYGDGDAHIAEVAPMMRGFAPSQRMSVGHHEDVGRAVEAVLATDRAPSRVYNVADDEAPDLATLFASVGLPPPSGEAADAGRAFACVMATDRIRRELGYAPAYPRLADAVAAGVA